MMLFFLLVLINPPDETLVMPHTYQTERACHQAAYARRNDYARFVCLELSVDNEKH